MKKLVLAITLVSALMACSSDSLSNSADAESASESSYSSVAALSSGTEEKTPVSYGIIPVDTNTPGGQSQALGDGEYIGASDDITNITSSSKTEYHFTTEKTILYEEPNGYTIAYYDELGLQYVGSDYNGGYLVTYRTLLDETRQYAGWLWSMSYSRSNEKCARDLELFNNKCDEYNGEFVNYREDIACTTMQLWLSCVYPIENVVDKAYMDSVAAVIHSYAAENWSAPYPAKDTVLSVSASSTSP